MALDVVTLSNNAIIDPEEAKAHATKDDPWAGEWLKRKRGRRRPYHLVRNEPGVEVVLESTKGYWRPEPYFQRIVLKFVPNEADRVLLLKKKAIDMVVGRPGLSPKNVKSLEGEQGLRVFQVPDTTCHWLCMNGSKPPFDNTLVRQAVNYAIPIQAILHQRAVRYGTQMKDARPAPHPGLQRHALAVQVRPREGQGPHGGGRREGADPRRARHPRGYTTHEAASVWDPARAREDRVQGFHRAGDRRHVPPGGHQGGHGLSIESFQSWVNDPWYHLVFNFHDEVQVHPTPRSTPTRPRQAHRTRACTRRTRRSGSAPPSSPRRS